MVTVAASTACFSFHGLAFCCRFSDLRAKGSCQSGKYLCHLSITAGKMKEKSTVSQALDKVLTVFSYSFLSNELILRN